MSALAGLLLEYAEELREIADGLVELAEQLREEEEAAQIVAYSAAALYLSANALTNVSADL